MRLTLRMFALLLPLLPSLWGQNVTSSVRGVVVDPSGAAIPGASCTLISQATGATQQAISGPDGAFVFPGVSAGNYNLVVKTTGFKGLETKNIIVTASEIRSLGNLTMALGEITESVSVVAEVATVQTASAEKSGLITGGQLTISPSRGAISSPC